MPHKRQHLFGAFLVGLVNTLLVASIGILIATVIGFIVGWHGFQELRDRQRRAALCRDPAQSAAAAAALFWYKAVLSVLPSPRQSLPEPMSGVFSSTTAASSSRKSSDKLGSGLIGYALLAAIAAAFGIALGAGTPACHRQSSFPAFWSAFGLIVLLPLLTFLVTRHAGRSCLCWNLKGFNFAGGIVVNPSSWRCFSACRSTRPPSSRKRACDVLAVPRPDGSRLLARPASAAHPATRRGSAGDAGDHSAADEPVSQPDEELVAGSEPSAIRTSSRSLPARC
ncbi:MAG: hypothetical protein HPM95_15495 [Alphaproteobacteria bacterium]|nr:hypothetical protein [Alphaproteobacteria bacterium]